MPRSSALGSSLAPDQPLFVLRYVDLVLLVLAAPILLLIGVPVIGYVVGAGVWMLLRGVGIGVDRYAGRAGAGPELSIRLGYMLGRLFALALTVILVRKDAGQNAGLTALLVIVFAFTLQLATSMGRPRRR